MEGYESHHFYAQNLLAVQFIDAKPVLYGESSQIAIHVESFEIIKRNMQTSARQLILHPEYFDESGEVDPPMPEDLFEQVLMLPKRTCGFPPYGIEGLFSQANYSKVLH